MTSADSSRVDKNFLANAMASFIQIAAVALLVMWCFSIVQPFLGIVTVHGGIDGQELAVPAVDA